jgi:hypothetical protein
MHEKGQLGRLSPIVSTAIAIGLVETVDGGICSNEIVECLAQFAVNPRPVSGQSLPLALVIVIVPQSPFLVDAS